MYGLLTKLSTDIVIDFSAILANANNKPVKYCELLLPSTAISAGIIGPLICKGRKPLFEAAKTFRLEKILFNNCNGLLSNVPSPINVISESDNAIIGANILNDNPLSPQFII